MSARSAAMARCKQESWDEDASIWLRSDGVRGHFGRSGALELPEALAEEVFVRGTELSTAIDQFAGEAGIRDAQGAWGVLSGNKITRQEAFRIALIAAFAPFFNKAIYRNATAGAT